MKNTNDRCNAFARSTGQRCRAKAMANTKCRNHGGLATGPKTPEGRHAIGVATRIRMASGQQEKALAGFYAWLDAGGRETLSRLAKARERRKRTLRQIINHTHRAHVGASWSLRVA